MTVVRIVIKPSRKDQQMIRDIGKKNNPFTVSALMLFVNILSIYLAVCEVGLNFISNQLIS